ncbi:MAG: hypothetical protein ACQERN_05495 [Thermodesulfobacteriota bacterium]
MTPPIEKLQKIYNLYDRHVDTLDLACEKYCADCCTANVTMTGLEGRLIVESISAQDYQPFCRRITAHRQAPRYQPEITTNEYAQICINGETPPEDGPPADSGACPLIENDACPIYSIRPFGCRCMVSTRTCGQFGQADIDDFTLTVNTVFLQCIEHLDADGWFGNFTDVLARLIIGDPKDGHPGPTVSNRRLPALLVPPPHREKIDPIVKALHAIIDGP